MTTQYIMDIEIFIVGAIEFFSILFPSVLDQETGEIEIRTFNPAGQEFFSSKREAAETAYGLCNQGIDVYFGVSPRIGKKGKKENVHYLTAFHSEIDYGAVGHNKIQKYLTYDEALNAIQKFNLQPTLIVHSGGGFHCYWVLNTPLKVSEVGGEIMELINKSLSLELGGDVGTHDISRVLRVPGTFNFKTSNPRPVEIVLNSARKYNLDDFKHLIESENHKKELPDGQLTPQPSFITPWDQTSELIDIDNLPIPEKIKSLILHGNDGSYISRSEADMAVITVLVNKGVSEDQIRTIFQNKNYRIGEKYRTHNAPDGYLRHSIEKAKERSNLTEEEMVDPLFISGALNKSDKRYSLKIVKFQEYVTRKYTIKVLDREEAFCKYNGKCYEHISDESLNMLCQKELGEHRDLFTKSSLNDFIHYAIGDAFLDSEKAHQDEINYLTLQNGLYKLDEGRLIPHTPDIYTTNLLPYDFNPGAQCSRFIQFLDEIFLGNGEIIEFVHQAVGYAFHKSIPLRPYSF